VSSKYESNPTTSSYSVSSSEKADPNKHYKSFNLLSLPYPGCEFFKKFRDNNYMARNLHYNWKQSFNDANINIPNMGPAADIDVAAERDIAAGGGAAAVASAGDWQRSQRPGCPHPRFRCFLHCCSGALS